jgi:hypothetical protein
MNVNEKPHQTLPKKKTDGRTLNLSLQPDSMDEKVPSE